MSGTSSASPDDLNVFVTQAGAATDRLDQAVGAATGTIMGFYDAPCDPQFSTAGDQAAFGQVKQLVTDDRTDERWIAGIRQAFITADTNTLPDGNIAASLRAQGINPTAPTQMTADEPVYQGATMYSGWTDDPVSTGAGHFLETEQDLAMPDGLQALAWTRVYSSRFVRSEGMGRGWYSWASTRLEVDGDQVVYHGPDGQVAPFGRVPGGFLGHPGMEGELVESPDGFELRWRWNARFPGMRWLFDAGGRLQRIVDPFRGETSAAYQDGRLVGLRHQGGRSLTIGWVDGRVAEIVSSDGRTVRYGYDGDDLVDVDRPAGTQRYVIGADGLVAEVYDADGVRLVRNEYDPEGRVTAQESPFGRITQYRYSAPLTLVVTDPDGGPAALYRHDQAGRLIETHLADGSRATRRFDAAGNPVRVVGFDGVVTERQFDHAGNCLREARPGTAGRTFAYDELGRIVEMVDETGAATHFSYDGEAAIPTNMRGPLGWERRFEVRHGLVVGVEDSDGVGGRFERDADGQVVAVVDGTGGVTELCYHPSGALAERRGPTGDVERWDLDGAGRPLAYTAADGARTERTLSPAGRVLAVTDPVDAAVRFEWSGHGELAAVIDPMGERTTFEWDRLGQRVGAQKPGEAAWAYEYDPVGRLQAFTDPTGGRWTATWAPGGRQTGLFDPLGRGVEVDYDPTGASLTARSSGGRRLDLRFDAAGRMIAGTADDGGSDCEVQRDALGRITSMSIDGQEIGRWTYTPGGRVASVSRPDGSMWRWTYDRAGRIARVSGPVDTQSMTYDLAGRTTGIESSGGWTVDFTWAPGDRLAEITSAGTTSRYQWDPAGRLVSEQYGDEAPRRYTYDQRGAVTEVVDGLGRSTTYAYNPRGALVGAMDGLGGRWACERDADDRMVAAVDPLGRRTSLQLDAGGRVVGMVTPDGSQYRYDLDPDGLLEAVGVGGRAVLEVQRDLSDRRIEARDEDGRTVTMWMDGLDRIRRYRGDGADTTWTYDDAGRAVTVATDSLPPVTVRVDGSGQPVGIAVEGLDEVAIERDRRGDPVRVSGPGLERTWTRDGAGRAVEYRQTVAGQEHVTRLERDGAGRVIAQSVDGVESRFRYDPAGQLVGVDGPGGTWEWEYDANGRLITEDSPIGRRRFHYDAADQLVRVDDAQGPTEFDYDGRGRRVRRQGPDGATEYRWSELDRLTGIEVSEAGQPTVAIPVVTDPLGHLAQAGTDRAGDIPGAVPGQLGLFLGDEGVIQVDGSPVLRFQPGRAAPIAASWTGDAAPRSPWGARFAPNAPDEPDRAALGWRGELEFDGVVWLRNRAYDPDTHTFLSPDPLAAEPGWAGALNPYLYAYNDPLSWLDPLGLKPITAAAASAQMQAWQQGHWKEALITGLAVVGTGILLATGGGALLLPMLIGAAAGGLSTAAGNYITTGHIDWGEVVMNTATGAFFGAAAGPLAGRVAGMFVGTSGDATAAAVARLTQASAMDQLPQLGRMAVNSTIGGSFGASQSALDSVGTGQPITLRSEALGTAGGALPGLIPTKTSLDVLNPETRDALTGWVGRHPNAWKLSNGLGRSVAAARDQVGFINNLRVQPPTFFSGAGANVLNFALGG